tara:strand:+ start:263 stop:631 length:369 start_codon:yes stop_codon:yes gene_type:complete
LPLPTNPAKHDAMLAGSSGAARWTYQFALDIADCRTSGVDAQQRGVRVLFAGAEGDRFMTGLSASDFSVSRFAADALRRRLRALLHPNAKVDMVALVVPGAAAASACPRLAPVMGCLTELVS